MSTLLVDLGNSRWKIARCDNGQLSDVFAGEHGEALAMPQDAVAVERVFLASVADAQTTARVQSQFAAQHRCPVDVVRATDAMPGIATGYRVPEQLGVDRLLAMVAVRACCQEPFCVVDAGTAVTIDFVDASGQHLGGLILPGLRLSRECLLANTGIPRDAAVDSLAELGRDTPTAVSLGARYAVAGAVERLTIGSAALFRGRETQVFVGGGDADALYDLLPSPCFKLDHLVLRGLAVLAAGGDG